jgi:hypothetical protein
LIKAAEPFNDPAIVVFFRYNFIAIPCLIARGIIVLILSKITVSKRVKDWIGLTSNSAMFIILICYLNRLLWGRTLEYILSVFWSFLLIEFCRISVFKCSADRHQLVMNFRRCYYEKG